MSAHVQVLSGLAGSSELWVDVAGRLQVARPDTATTVEDVPWQGHGSWALPGWDADKAIGDLVHADAVVVAHSFAATLALAQLCRTDRARPAGVVLISPFYRPETTDFAWSSLEHFLLRFHEFLETGLVARSTRMIDADVRFAMAKTVRDWTGPYGWMAFMTAYLATPSFDLSQADMPITVVYGTDDGVAPPEDAVALADLLPNADLQPVASADHFPMTSHPELITEVICAVISRAEYEAARVSLATTSR